MKKIPCSYIVIPAIVFLSTNLSSQITIAGAEWARSLALPNFAPPMWFNETIWQLVNIFAALAAVLVWESLKRTPRFWAVISCLGTSAGLIIIWTYVFYNLHMLQIACWKLELITALVMSCIVMLWNPLRLAAYLLMPLAGWLAFKSYIVCSIWQLNQTAGMVEYFKWW